MEYTGKQLMAIALANEIEDGKVYIIGTGLPLIGASLAKHTTAPNARLLFETGILEEILWKFRLACLICGLIGKLLCCGRSIAILDFRRLWLNVMSLMLDFGRSRN